jgi:hypothetical protein
MKNKLFFAKFLATRRHFVYAEEVIARALEDRFRGLDLPVHTWRKFMAKKPKKTKG